MTELIYKDLSYKLAGLAFEVCNKIGFGQSEKVYADAFEELLKRDQLVYSREVYFPVTIEGKVIKRCYFDFLINDKVIIEFKIASRFYRDACSQIFQYLKNSNKKLGLIFRIMPDGVRIKRIPNYY